MVQWWDLDTPLYRKVVNTGRATVVVRSGHWIAKIIALNVRDDDRFRARFVHPPSLTHSRSRPTSPRLPSTRTMRNPRPVLADANIGQLSVGEKNQLMSVLKLQNFAGLFPEDAKSVADCTGKVLRIYLADERCAPIAAKQ